MTRPGQKHTAHHRDWRFLILAGLLFSGLTGTAKAQTDPLLHWQDKAYIERSFYKIALNNEYEGGQQSLRRWEEPIRYHLLFESLPNNAMVQTLVKTHFDHLAAITGVTIRPVKTRREANFLVVLTRDRHYQKAIQTHTRAREPGLHTDSHCMASIQVRGDGRLSQAQVVIPLDHAMQRGVLPACVVEETTQAMGLPNDADDVTPSIANDASRLDLLTGLDYVFLKLLYHPQLRAGMSQAALQKRLPAILDQFEQQGLIKGAAQAVNRKGLYRLLY